MTSVPKPLKFLRPFYQDLIQVWEQWDSKKLTEQKVRILYMHQRIFECTMAYESASFVPSLYLLR
jgi:hypothetical protein